MKKIFTFTFNLVLFFIVFVTVITVAARNFAGTGKDFFIIPIALGMVGLGIEILERGKRVKKMHKKAKNIFKQKQQDEQVLAVE